MRIVILIFSFSLLLISCKKDNEETLYGESKCLPEQLSFSVNIQPLLSNSCSTIGCHVQGGSGNGLFENYKQVKAKVDNGSLLQRTVISKDMPPNGSLSSCEIETIQQWISDGAPNN